MKRSLNNQFEINNALISESNLIDCISNTFITSGSGGGGGPVDFTNILNTNLTSTNSRITNATISSLNITGNSTCSNILLNQMTASNILNTNLTSANSFITNATISSLNITGGLTSSNILSSQMTASNILNTNLTSANSIITNLTSGTIDTTNLIANGTAYISNLENTNLITTSSIAGNRGTISNLNNTSLTSSNIYVSDQISYIANSSNSYQIKLSGNDIRLIGAEDQSTVRSFVFGSFAGNNSSNTWFPTATIQTCSRGVVQITNNLSAGSLSSPSSTISNMVSTNSTVSNLVCTGISTFGTLRAGTVSTLAGGSISTQTLNVGPGVTALSVVTGTNSIFTTTTANSGYTGGCLNITGGSTLSTTTIANLSLGNNGIFNEVSKTYTNNATTLMATFGSTVFRAVEIIASNRIITSTTPRTAIYKIYGYYDNNSWSISETQHGNNFGTFSINSSGELSFNSSNEVDFISATMKLRQTFISI